MRSWTRLACGQDDLLAPPLQGQQPLEGRIAESSWCMGYQKTQGPCPFCCSLCKCGRASPAGQPSRPTLRPSSVITTKRSVSVMRRPSRSTGARGARSSTRFKEDGSRQDWSAHLWRISCARQRMRPSLGAPPPRQNARHLMRINILKLQPQQAPHPSGSGDLQGGRAAPAVQLARPHRTPPGSACAQRGSAAPGAALGQGSGGGPSRPRPGWHAAPCCRDGACGGGGGGAYCCCRQLPSGVAASVAETATITLRQGCGAV
jgi:hypothetical protein